ncbi:MAG: hypothetical protein NTY00_09280 [Deltaproteobacteria bacterium]|nr:hypothetical protein [Deltaproteobacteria bacterium]
MTHIRFWKNWAITTRIGAVISLGAITSILVMVIGAVSFLKKEYLTTFGKQQFATVQAFALSLNADLSQAEGVNDGGCGDAAGIPAENLSYSSPISNST